VIDPARLAPGWRDLVDDFQRSASGRALLTFLDRRRAAGATVFPPCPLRALELTPPERVRVVILGQDPYHGPGQAHGLAFSVPAGVRPPPSLRNILRELADDLGGTRTSGDLESWARQGVLLLNTVFTVEAGQPASHAGRGWEALSDAILARLSQDAAPKVFLLWGAHAQARRTLLGAGGGPHEVLLANHPSPLSARRPPVPFLGCRHFSRTNAWLADHGRGRIDWLD
jgi:uracil-DNA glycosylase